MRFYRLISLLLIIALFLQSCATTQMPNLIGIKLLPAEYRKDRNIRVALYLFDNEVFVEIRYGKTNRMQKDISFEFKDERNKFRNETG